MRSKFVFGVLLLGITLFAGDQVFAGIAPAKMSVAPQSGVSAVEGVIDPGVLNNLLSNPDFENGFNSWLDAGPGWGIQSDIVHGGTRAALNTIGTIPGQDYFASLSQTVLLNAGQTIYATLWAKSIIDVRANAVAGVLVQFLRSNDSEISRTQNLIGGQTDWRQLYVTATAPTGTAKVKYSVFVYAAINDGLSVGGRAYFDDAVLSTEPIAPPAPRLAPLNAGFENGFNDWNRIYPAIANAAAAFSVDATSPFEGLYSNKNSIVALPTISGQEFFASTSQDLVYAGGPIYAAAHIKTNFNPSSTGTAGLLLEFFDASGIRVASTQQVKSGVNPWTRVLINGYAPPSTTTRVRVSLFTYAAPNDTLAIGGTANFDNVIVSYLPLPAEFRTTLSNSGYENGLSDWSDVFGNPATVSTTAHSGTYSAKKTISLNATGNYYSQIYQDIYFNANGDPYPTNTIVYGTAYVKTSMNPVTKSQAGLQFEFINAAGQVIVDGTTNQPITFKNFVGGQTDWRQVYAAIGTPAGTVRVRVSGVVFARQQESGQGGEAFFDDFQFSLSYLPGVRMREQLYNGGFENGINDWDEFNSPAEVSSSVKRTGNFAGMFTFVQNPLITTDYFGSISQDIRVYPKLGGSARFTVWVKTSMATAVLTSASISLQFLDGAKNPVSLLYASSVIRGTQDWTLLSVTGTMPRNAIMARVSCNVAAPVGETNLGQRVYFDDALFSSKGYIEPIPVLDRSTSKVKTIQVQK